MLCRDMDETAEVVGGRHSDMAEAREGEIPELTADELAELAESEVTMPAPGGLCEPAESEVDDRAEVTKVESP